MKKNFSALVLVLAAFSFCACSSGNADRIQLAKSKQPIVNGTLVTGTDYMATVGMQVYYSGTYATFCTGTLISPTHVLTAAHCVSDKCGDDMSYYRANMYVFFGQNEKNANIKRYKVKSIVEKEDFICSNMTESAGETDEQYIANDIAILELSTPVPASVARPIPLIPHDKLPTANDMKRSPGVLVTSVGFGITGPSKDDTGVKYKISRNVVVYCDSKNFSASVYSNLTCNDFSHSDGYMYLWELENTADGLQPKMERVANTCQGDSGGPTFVENGEFKYVYGITSYGDADCQYYSAMTSVDRYRDFVQKNVPDVSARTSEICDNDIDDNGDGRIDCEDPYCYYASHCATEICNNGRDDDGNGSVDCDDLACLKSKKCQPEICDNHIDDNDNGKIDCEDDGCKDQKICQPEICDNHIDDNGNGKIDCDDDACKDLQICLPEICNNYIDDNADGRTDCDDPQCMGKPECLADEICDDHVDNDGDGAADCDDSDCISDPACQKVEICNDQIDNDGDGAADCLDSDCFGSPECLSDEICDDQIDNDGDGATDCNDSDCFSDPACSGNEEICYDNIDNDGDGATDCNDSDCVSAPECSSTPDGKTDGQTEICHDGFDNDQNGQIDCKDAACKWDEDCILERELEETFNEVLSCSASPSHSSHAPAALVFFLLPFWLVRRRSNY